MIYKQGMREVLSDPWAFLMHHKQNSSGQAVKGEELGCLWLKQAEQLQLGEWNHTAGCKQAQVSPVAQWCLGEAQYSFTSTPQMWMLSGLYPNLSKDKLQFHSTSPTDNLCCGKCHWMDVNHFIYRWFSIWTWTVLHGGQNCTGSMSQPTQEGTCCSL